MTHECTTKRGHPELVYWILVHCRKYLYLFYLCKLLTYGHQPTDAPQFDLLFKVTGQDVDIQFWINYGGTNCNQ